MNLLYFTEATILLIFGLINSCRNMKNKLYLITSLLFFLFTIQYSFATYDRGGDIQYRLIGPNTYEIQLRMFSVENGISYPLDLHAISIDCSDSIPLSPTLMQYDSLNYSCSSSWLGKFDVWLDTVVLGSCDDWKISYLLGAPWPGGNLDFSSWEFYIEAEINATIPNSSPDFLNPIAGYVSNDTTQLISLSYNAFDFEGDSLVYEIIPSKTGPSSNHGYSGAFTYDHPFDTSVGSVFELNPVTGHMQFSLPNQNNIDRQLTIEVHEYRDGVYLGSIMRDVNVGFIYASATNPQLLGYDFGNSIDTTIVAGSTFMTDILGVSSGGALDLVLDAGLPGATITIAGTSTTPIAQIEWVTAVSDARSQPYVFTLTGIQDDCPTRSWTVKTYSVTVVHPDSVWPGDANADGVCNAWDVLPVGLAYGETGPARSGASILWTPQFASDFSGSFATGLNYKHADCNGDGQVEVTDLLAVLNNYGLTHSKQDEISTTGPVLKMDFPADTVGANQVVHVPVVVGDASNPVTDLHGIAFRVNFDPSVVDSASFVVNYGSTVLGIDHLQLDTLMYGDGFIDIAVSQKNGAGFSGYGEICQLEIVTADDLIGKDVIVKSFGGGISHVRALDVIENEVELQIDTNQMYVSDGVLTTQDQALEQFTFNYNSQLKEVTTNKDADIWVYDMQGRVVASENSTQNIQIAHLTKGVYLLHFNASGKVLRTKILF